MFYYSDTAPRGQFQGNVWNMDANKAYMRHFDNLMYLYFMAKEGTFVERRQAEKEIGICKRKLEFWERHPKFCGETVRPLKENKIKEWKGRV